VNLEFPRGRWTAKWIWPHRSTDWDAPTARRTAVFRHDFDLESRPQIAPARVAAVGRAQWFVNGHEIGRGPVRANPQQMRWDDHDIAEFLRVGTNSIAIMVTADVDATAWSMPLPASSDLRNGALAVEVFADGRLVTASDDSWRGRILHGWSATASASLLKRGDETVDLRSLAADWTTSSAHDWPVVKKKRAMVLGASGRDTPPTHPLGPWAGRPTSRPRPTPVPFTSSGGGVFVAPRITVGTLVIDVEGPAGAIIEIKGAERLQPTGEPRHEAYDSSYVVTTDGTRRAIESVDLFGVHAVSAIGDGSVTVHSVAIRERLHPVDGGLHFACSDPTLEEVFAVGRRTVSICSLDAYVDCPTREQRAWTGDSVVHQMIDLTTNTDWSLARWHPQLTATPRSDGMLPMAVAGEIEHTDISIIPDWALHWVHSVHNLFRYTADRETLTRLLPVVERVVQWFAERTDEHGLPVDLPGWVLIDWSAVHSDGANSTIAGLWGRSLLEFVEMSEWLGDGGRAAWARQLHARLADGFEQLWDPERRLYVDTMVDGRRRPMTSQHAQAAAIVGGLAPRERWPRLVDVICDETNLVHAAFARADGPSDPGTETELGGVYMYIGHPEPWWDTERQVVRAQPFFRYVVHDAIALAGAGSRLSRLLLDWRALLDRCSTSFGETWYGGTTCHGWSSTPTRDLIQHVLGVQPDAYEPGSLVIAPNLGHLDWIEADVPTIDGVVRVRVERSRITVRADHRVHVRSGSDSVHVIPGVTTVLPRTIIT